MTTEEFLRDICPNHTDKSKWNKSELLHILELHTEQLRKHTVSNRRELLITAYKYVTNTEERAIELADEFIQNSSN